MLEGQSYLSRAELMEPPQKARQQSLDQLIPPLSRCGLLMTWAGGKAHGSCCRPLPQASPLGDPENNLASQGIKTPFPTHWGEINHVTHDNRVKRKSTMEKEKKSGGAGKNRWEATTAPSLVHG